MSLAQRSVSSISWNAIVSLLGYPVGMIQSILLARLLPVEYFGVFAGVTSIVNISYVFFDFGLGNALMHRSPETQDEGRAAAVFFTLRLVLDTIWFVLLIVFGLIYLTSMRQTILIVLAITNYLNRLTVTPRTLLIRRVQHRRMAIMDMFIGQLSALLSVLIAWLSGSIWALLISSVISLVGGIIGLYLIRPVWKPYLAWSKASAAYYLNFGGRNLINSLLDAGMDNLDNLWTSHYLGDQALGYYSRAFKFAIYPRMILALPVNAVVIGTYAELKYDRLRLSKAFFRTLVLLTRAGFLLSGGLAVVAPEFITIFLGEKWLPMLAAFRLMLLYSLLDPIRITTAGVLVAAGKPEKVSLVRLLQLPILLGGMFALGFRYQIAGVALSINAMVTVGVLVSLYLVRAHVDFSLSRLFVTPLLSLAAGLGLSFLAAGLWDLSASAWLALLVKGTAFSLGYLGVTALLEGATLYRAFNERGASHAPLLAAFVQRVRQRLGGREEDGR